jgi:chromate transporter
MSLLFLFANFFKIGLFSVGGGYAILPFLFEMADNSSGINTGAWLSRELIGNMLAVAQSMPGAIGANLSAYTGIHYAGVPGAYTAALGLTAPSVIIIMIVARTLQAFKESALVMNLFSGLRPAAAGLLSAAAFWAISLALWNAAAPVWYEYIRWKEGLIFIILFFLVWKFKKHPVVYILVAGFAGVLLKL